MKYTILINALFSAALLSSGASAHMKMVSPAPINADTDEFYTAPLKRDGSDFPCRGHLKDLASAPVAATWAAGTTQTFELGKDEPHYGGSSQVSMSYDQGQTWRVLKSFPGSCPHRVVGEDQTFTFPLPAEAPSGEALFSWSWVNRENEMYHNCAVVSITGGGSGLDHLPRMLEVAAGTDCASPPNNMELQFPNPGKVVELGDGEYPLALPVGSACGL